MLITKDYLKSLSPCEDRYEHYLTNYKDWSGSLEEFLDLSELTHDDKKWVFVRSIDNDKLRLVAADFAERVLHIYENKYPNDDLPRKSIEAARSANNAYTAADDAYAAYAAYVAYTAGAAAGVASAAGAAGAAAYAAAGVASAAGAARDAAAYAAYAVYADAAAASAAYAAARVDEEKAQLEIMKKYAREAFKEIE